MESPHSRQISVSGRLVIEGQLPDPRSAPSSENASVPPLPPRWTHRFARVCLKYLKSSLEIAGIAIALALVILTLLTLKQIKRQADLAQKQLTESIALFRTDERAWMGFSFMGGNLGLTIGQSFLVPTELLNSGKTPARQIMGDIVVRVIAKGETLDFDYTPGHGNTAYQINAGTIFPKGTIKEFFEGLVHGRKEASFDTYKTHIRRYYRSSRVYRGLWRYYVHRHFRSKLLDPLLPLRNCAGPDFRAMHKIQRHRS